MKVLEYPFNTNEILSKKKKIKRELLEENRERTKKNIAILGGSTTSNIKLIMELFLLDNGIEPQFYESEYNQYYEDAVFQNEKLIAFKPDIIYICTSNRNIDIYPRLEHSEADIDSLIENVVTKFRCIWERLETQYACPIIQNNFEMPYYRLLGNKEASDIHGRINFLTRINMEFYSYAQKHENFYICDINYISADYGLKEWADPFFWYMYKYAMNVSAIPYLSFNVANIIKSIFGKNKKGFVLDLDNTLWGGVIGDDGVDNIVIGPEEPVGQAYSEFQEYMKDTKQLGVILNINSKNEEANALTGLNHPDGVLRPNDFIIIKANWESKDRNFNEIAKELNLLPESLVFIDDNPAERHIVMNQIKGVRTPDIGNVHQYIQTIDRGGYFEVTTLSLDDQNRTEMYKDNLKRAKLEAEFLDYKDYLRSLDMKAMIKPFETIFMSRIAQLSNKSNQFNLMTKRYTQAEIEKISLQGEYITLYGKLIDKFGDNGIVSVVIGHKLDGKCHIDLWIMSCRVLKRDMEFAMMDALVEQCKKNEISEIYGYYYPTSKNGMVKDFYQLQGFQKIKEDTIGNTEWKFVIPEIYQNKNEVILMEE